MSLPLCRDLNAAFPLFKKKTQIGEWQLPGLTCMEYRGAQSQQEPGGKLGTTQNCQSTDRTLLMPEKGQYLG